MRPCHILDISEIDIIDLEQVGKKAFELSEIKHLGVPIPEGLVITTSFFEEFLKTTGISEDIDEIKKISHPSLKDSIGKLYEPIGTKVMRTHIPHNLAVDLHKFYRKLAGRFKETSVNIFSSTSTNKTTIFTNIKGDANIILKIKTIWSFHLDNPVAIVIHENIDSKIKGKIFTDNPIIDKRLTEMQMGKIVDYCKIIQNHFYFPKEIEYMIKKDKIFITAVNPFTGNVEHSPKQVQSNITTKRKMLVKGVSINPGIVTGPVRILNNNSTAVNVKKGEIIILRDLNISMHRKIKNAKAVVVDSILPNSLSKTLYRKNFKIPTVEGTKDALKIFQNGNIVTVNGVSGEIYSGGLVY